jgi:hypothetical protein
MASSPMSHPARHVVAPALDDREYSSSDIFVRTPWARAECQDGKQLREFRPIERAGIMNDVHSLN